MSAEKLFIDAQIKDRSHSMKKTVLVSMRIDKIKEKEKDSVEQRLLTLYKSDYSILIPNILFELGLLEKWIIDLKPHSILLSEVMI